MAVATSIARARLLDMNTDTNLCCVNSPWLDAILGKEETDE